MFELPTWPSRSPQVKTDEENSVAPSASPAEPSPEEIGGKPWKYVGYKRYAEFISSDDDLLIFRRFTALNARVALLLQDRVSELEEKLKEIDYQYSNIDAPDINNGSFRDDMKDRDELMNEITKRLERYNNFLIQQSQLREFTRAPKRDIQSLKTWHENFDNSAIDQDEQVYLSKTQDLVRLKSQDKTVLREWIDSSLQLRTLSIWKKKSREVPKYEANNVSYYSDRAMDSFASSVIVFIGAVILITPLWVLQAMNNLTKKLAVITVFVLVFLLVLSFMLVAKPFEVLAATAAYAAVLMVFIQVG
ncbi:hypothetical protein F5Y18DRAFT_377102 [Xylariaceae sp. FL1019]|nr:hypothetical protein F5Y18DRAFT_377102 [Xylariaceae sp. FL1019]